MLPALDEVEQSLANDNTEPTQEAFEDAWVEPEDRLQAQESVQGGSSSERVPTADESASTEQKDNKDKTALSTRKRGDSAVTLLTGVDPRNIITVSSDEEDWSLLEGTSCTPFVQKHGRNLRTRNTKQSKLNYDQKYHPMDDSIRPLQAARRRSMYREEEPSSDDSSNAYHECAANDTDSAPEHLSDDDGVSMSAKKGKKRTKSEVDLPQPTRRSSRKTSNLKVSYSMKVHPQDKDLEMLSDESDVVEKSASKRRKSNRGGSCDSVELSGQTELDFHENTSVKGSSRRSSELQTPSSSSSVATPPIYMVRHIEGLDVWRRPLGHRYFPHERNSHVIISGQDFEIFTERIEDQLEREANSFSPLNFDHDDKENPVDDSDLGLTPNPLGRITVTPASQHRQTIEDNYVSNEMAVVRHALYDIPEGLSCPYGLGGGDGARDEETPAAKNDFEAECIRILRSSS